jgi:RAD51-like protein 3
MNVTSPPLSTFTPLLPETLVANLSVLNIHTAPDLIFIPPSELVRRLPKGSITFTELTRHIAHVTQAFAGPAITGDKLIEELDALAQFESVSSGLPALDGLVGSAFGGASGGRVVEICGPRASGKTVREWFLLASPPPLRFVVVDDDDKNFNVYEPRYLRYTSSCIT